MAKAQPPMTPKKVTRDEEDVALIAEFLHESDEGLEKVDQLLLQVEKDGCDPETVNGLFRVFHTIKGVSGFLDFQIITELAHTTETMMDRVRGEKLQLQGEVLDLVFDATSAMRGMLDAVRQAVESEHEIPPTAGVEKLLERIAGVTESSEQSKDIRAVDPSAASSDAPSKGSAVSSSRKNSKKSSKEKRTPPQVVPSPEAATPQPDSPTPMPTPKAQPASARMREVVKVDLERVDNLVDNIGELVIVESMVTHAAEQTEQACPHLFDYLSQLSKITRELQDIGLSLRMIPVRSLFQKMSRMTRDLARTSGKRITVVLKGEASEMDRNMVDLLADPLVHLIRNAVDHGVETPEQRRAAGKPDTATLRLASRHEGGNMVVEISEDGRGLDCAAILEKASRQGLLGPGQQLSESEIYELIFEPGFSTAKQVSNISGRGVGLDVVRRNIESMRGRVQVSSEPGQGTMFRLVLPITLAVIDGTVVLSGRERYILPTLSIIESFKPAALSISMLPDGSEIIRIRKEVLPLVRLEEMLGIDTTRAEPCDSQVVIVESLGKKVGFLVDEVVTRQQVVIKSLAAEFNELHCFAGAAILSDGRVGLILDVDDLTDLYANQQVTLHDEMQQRHTTGSPGHVAPSSAVLGS